MKQWFVAQTQPMKETFAENELKNQHFEVYLPRYEKTRRHARKVETVFVPLFPRYIFVEFDPEVDQWRKVNGTRGISYLLTNNERPAPIPTSIIERMKAQETDENLIDISSLTLFTEGEQVHIKEGAFEGQTATFETMDGKQRAHLLLKFLGRETKIQVPLHMFESL